MSNSDEPLQQCVEDGDCHEFDHNQLLIGGVEELLLVLPKGQDFGLAPKLELLSIRVDMTPKSSAQP